MSEWTGRTLGPYLLGREIGRGGETVVYEAIEPGLGSRHVAVEVLHPETGADRASCERFRREIEARASLAHPHILPVLEAGVEDGVPWCATPRIDGRTLEERVRSEGRMAGPEVVGIVRQVAFALEHANRRGMLHRSLCGGDVLLLPDGTVVVVGFRERSECVGHPRHAPPELLRDEEVDARADVYALAVIAFHALTGVHPFGEVRGVPEMIERKLRGPVPAARERQPDLPVGADEVLSRAMAPRRESRYRNAVEFAEAFAGAFVLPAPADAEGTAGETRRHPLPACPRPSTALARRSVPPTRIRGLSVGDQIGEGSYARVYRAAPPGGGVDYALKIAKSPAEVGADPGARTATEAEGPRAAPASPPSQALVFWTGNMGSARPDPAQLLFSQVRRMQWVVDPALPAVESFGEEDGLAFAVLHFFAGETLRQRLRAGPVPLGVFHAVAAAMQRLVLHPEFRYHGDLKPENILVGGNGIGLVDPGHFGNLPTVDEGVQDLRVTTPAYYPDLQPDDLSALGIILWEAACGKHPLRPNPGGDAPTRVGPNLAERLRLTSQSGNRFLEPIRDLRRPTVYRPELPEGLEETLLRGLRLRVLNDGALEIGRGFDRFSDLLRALEPYLDLAV